MKQMELENKQNTSKAILGYSLFFIGIIVLIYGYFVQSGTSFIWHSDGFTQHYLLFKDYLGMWRDFFLNPLNGFQHWDWTIGLGADVISSYGYYVVGDPFVYLGLLFPVSMTEFAFHFLVLLRIYCIGVAFIFYARKMGMKGTSLLAGTLVYTFAHYVTLNATRHPFFLMPMILFPLLCLGIEKILHQESALFFSVVVFFSATSNFYFLYKLTIMVFIYAIFRYGSLYWTEKSWRHFWPYFWKTLYHYLIGVFLSALVLFPVIWGFLQSSREQGGEFAAGMMLYPFEYYASLITNIFVSESYLWTVLGFAGIVMLVIPLFFTRRKQFGWLPYILILCVIMLLFPAFGSIMNGFSGPYNRWTFVLPLYLGLAVAQFYQKRFDWAEKDRRSMAIGLLFFAGVALIAQFIEGFSIARSLPVLAAAFVWGILVLASKWNREQPLSSMKKRVLSALILVSIVGNIIYNAQDYYYPTGQNAMAGLIDYGTADEQYEQIFDEAEQVIPSVTNENIFRIGSTAKDNHIRNHMVYLERMGLNSYLSITNGSVAQFSRQLELGSFQLIQPVRNGLDDRRIANHLLGVRYIVTPIENEQYLPYGYEVIYRTEGENAHLVAETEDAYPFAYANPVFLNNATFETLNPVEKEEFLASGFTAADEEVDSSKLTAFDEELTTKEIGFTVRSQNEDKISIDGNIVRVNDESGKIEIQLNTLEDIQNTEVYVQLIGLDFVPEPNGKMARENTSFNATVALNNRNKTIHQSDKMSFSTYLHRKKMLFNLGYQTGEGSDTITLQLKKPGIYHLEEIKIYALPLAEDYEEKVAEKKSNQLNITEFENEHISGHIKQTEDSMLVTSIPYSVGWTAQVNGKEVETVKVNYGFIGIPLEAGESTIEFSYHTPFLRTGLVFSLIGLILFMIEAFKWKKRNR